jgi:hypothetical protein
MHTDWRKTVKIKMPHFYEAFFVAMYFIKKFIVKPHLSLLIIVWKFSVFPRYLI